MSSSSSWSKTVTVSAPGKILLAGGYLVLESPNPGVVISVNKRFYCRITASHCTAATAPSSFVVITVSSPQFGQEWSYSFDKTSLTLSKQKSTCTTNNAFVEKTLRVALLALLYNNINTNKHASSLLWSLERLDLVIRGDNDFYSLVPHLQARNLPLTLEGALQLEPFLPAARSNDIHGKILKTGLGSSACLVTSLVAALVHVLDDPSLSSQNQDELIYKLAQICHCHAQGKVGSGFDVAAACFGSHLYQCFPKETIADLLMALEEVEHHHHHDDGNDVMTQTASMIRTKLYETKWQGGVQAPLYMPFFLQVMLADVSGGSESPGMARSVLAWKNQRQLDAATATATATALEDNPCLKNKIPHWDDLAVLNPKVGDLWRAASSLVSLSPALNQDLLQKLATTCAEEWNDMALVDDDNSNHHNLPSLLYDLHVTLNETRKHLKAMGDAVEGGGVPIEPPEQTELIHATMALPGVVAALVPGAGGYDAVACVYINTESVRHAVGQLWSSWTKTKVCPLTVQGISYGQGVRIEEEEEEDKKETTVQLK